MPEQVNEFTINLPMTGVGAVGAVCGSAIDCTPTPLPTEVNGSQASHINVYVDGSPTVNQIADSPLVSMDLVLNVSIQDQTTGTSRMYKVVKRLSMDKCKLAVDAETLTPYQVVEGEDEPEDPVLVEAEMRAFNHTRQLRAAAGLPEGGTHRAQVRVRSVVDGEERRETVIVEGVRDRAHARHVFQAKHGLKYPNGLITRVTMLGKGA